VIASSHSIFGRLKLQSFDHRKVLLFLLTSATID
jgi:hypothetical protein